MPETEDWDEDDEWSSEEEGGELADPDGAPLQDIQSHAPSATAPHDDEEAEAGEHQTDDEDVDQGRQKSTYGGSDDEEGYERSHTGGYGSRGRGDDDEGKGQQAREATEIRNTTRPDAAKVIRRAG